MYAQLGKILITLEVAGVLIVTLPISPFEQVVEAVEGLPFLGELNWFFPVGDCLLLMTAWCGAITGYYSISWILRQLGMVGD